MTTIILDRRLSLAVLLVLASLLRLTISGLPLTAQHSTINNIPGNNLGVDSTALNNQQYLVIITQYPQVCNRERQAEQRQHSLDGVHLTLTDGD